ncbi:MAG: hypothetical protein LBS60_04405 [Deltaproteobacteria bacterium]|jgi:hypothetical protein|nr:hypothetical protein [Deltaproteobacteria bacterium]
MILALAVAWPQSRLMSQMNMDCCDSGSTLAYGLEADQSSPSLKQSLNPSHNHAANPDLSFSPAANPTPIYQPSPHPSHNPSHNLSHTSHNSGHEGLGHNLAPKGPKEAPEGHQEDHMGPEGPEIASLEATASSAPVQRSANPVSSDNPDPTSYPANSCGLSQCPGYQVAAFPMFKSSETPVFILVFTKPLERKLVLAPAIQDLFRPPRLA